MAELKDCTTNFFPEICRVNVVIDQQAQTGTDDDRLLIIGQMDATGTATAGVPYRVQTDNVGALFGENSPLNQMITDAQDIAPTAEIWAFPVVGVGTAGESTITVSGVDTATASGVVYLWVNGRTYQTFFDPSIDTNDTVAARLSATINDGRLTVVAAADVVTITTNALGEVDGFLDVRTSYSLRPDLVSSAEITLTAATVSGTGFPDLSALAALTEGFEFVANPYTDTNSVAAVSAYVCGQWSGGANSRAYGVFYGDLAQAEVFGQTANDALLSYLATDGALTPPYLETSAYAAIAWRNMNCQSDDIAASLTGNLMPAMLAPESADRFSDADKAALVESGLGYFDVLRNNDVTIGRAVTTYTVANNGTLDLALRDVNKPAMLACISRFFREEITSRFTGYSFRSDGIVGGNSTRVATISAIRNFVITLATRLSDRNLLQDLEGFIESLDVSVDPDTNCISIIAEPVLVDQFCCSVITLRTI